MTKQEIIKLLRKPLSSEQKRELKEKLKEIYQEEYKPKHSKEVYFDLMMEWEVGGISERFRTTIESKEPTLYETFACVSQHIHGKTKEHCLDILYDIVKKEKKEEKIYLQLPTIDDLINSDVEIIPENIYKIRVPDLIGRHTKTYTGKEVLRIKEVGYDAFWEESFIYDDSFDGLNYNRELIRRSGSTPYSEWRKTFYT